MASDYYTKPSNPTDGDVAYASDVSNINNEVDAAFSRVLSDINATQSISAASQSWAIGPGGVSGDAISANHGGDGSTTFSSKYWSHQSKTHSITASGWSATAESWSDTASGWAAQASATIASGTVLTAGQGIVINTAGTPTTATVIHGDTTSASSVNNSGLAAIQDLLIDTYGHVTGSSTKTFAASDFSSALMPISGGTFSGGVTTNTVTAGGDFTLGSYTIKQGAAGSYLDLGATYAQLWSSTGGSECRVGVNGIDFRPVSLGSGEGFNMYHGGSLRGRITATSAGVVQLYGTGNQVTMKANSIGKEVGIYNSNHFRSSASGNMYCGWSTHPWIAVYSVNVLQVTSDETKKNLKDLKDGEADWLYNLVPYEFTWKEDDNNPDKYTYYGFSAQDVDAKKPDKKLNVVQKKLKDKDLPTDPDEFIWTVGHTELMAPMLKLIQEQKATIDDLTARIEVLESV